MNRKEITSLMNLVNLNNGKKLDKSITMTIKLLQTMQWSKLCWDKSWEYTIELEDLLPEVGKKYPINNLVV